MARVSSRCPPHPPSTCSCHVPSFPQFLHCTHLFSALLSSEARSLCWLNTSEVGTGPAGGPPRRARKAAGQGWGWGAGGGAGAPRRRCVLCLAPAPLIRKQLHFRVEKDRVPSPSACGCLRHLPIPFVCLPHVGTALMACASDRRGLDRGHQGLRPYCIPWGRHAPAPWCVCLDRERSSGKNMGHLMSQLGLL